MSYRVFAIVSPKHQLELQTRDLQAAVAKLSPDGVLIRVAAAGVCHTDLHLWQGGYRVGRESWLNFADRPGYGYPIVPGHEIAGSVYALGDRVPPSSTLSIGDRVAGYSFSGCDDCAVCAGGDPHLCAQGRTLGFLLDGGYSEYVAIPHWKYAVKLPNSISYQQGCLISCGGLTAYSAIKTAQPAVERVKRWGLELFVAVIGLGGLGQWALRLLPHCVPGLQMKVVGVDIDQEKLKSAREENLVDDTLLFDRAGDVEATSSLFHQMFLGKKLHVVFDFVNSETTCSFAMRSLHTGGMLLALGLHGGAFNLALPLLPLNSYTLSGMHGGSLEQMRELVQLVDGGRVRQSLVTEYPFLEANKALQDLKNGLISGRGVLIL